MRFATPNYLTNSFETAARFGKDFVNQVQTALVPTRYGTTLSSLGPVTSNIPELIKKPIKAAATATASALTDADRLRIWRYTNVNRASAAVTGKTTQTLGAAAGAVAQKAVPIGLMVAAGQLGNIGQGFRPAGYKSIIPVSKEEDPTGRESISPLLEGALRYTTLGGRSQLLPYAEFKQERPDVMPSTYTAYRRYEFSKPKPGELFSVNTADQSFTTPGGFLRGTLRGLNDPEIRVRGVPITLSGGLGAIAGIGAANLVSSGLIPRSKEYTEQLNKQRNLQLEKNEIASEMLSRMDVIRTAAKQRDITLPTKPGPERKNDFDPISANKWMEQKAALLKQEGRLDPSQEVKPFSTSKNPLTQQEKVEQYLKKVGRVAEKVGVSNAGQEYSFLYGEHEKKSQEVASAIEKTSELRKTLEPNILQRHRQAAGLIAGVGTAVLVGSAVKKLMAKAEERRVKKENPVEYLRYKHGDLAAAKEALGQPQARSWQDLTPYVK